MKLKEISFLYSVYEKRKYLENTKEEIRKIYSCPWLLIKPNKPMYFK